jgi:hypothetical protein
MEDKMRTHNPGVLIPLLVLAWFVVWSAGGCSDPTVWERVVTISGEVVDASTQEPLDSAWIVMGDTTIVRKEYTDSLGQFSLPSPPFPSSHKVLYAGQEGYHTGIDTVWNAAHDVSDIRIELERGEP